MELGRIDIHAHHVGRDLIDAVRDGPDGFGVHLEVDPTGERLRFPDGSLVRPFFRELWDLDLRIAAMDARGVAIQAISTWTDICGDGLLAGEPAVAWARLQNESLAALPEAELEATWSANARTLLGLAKSWTSFSMSQP